MNDLPNLPDDKEVVERVMRIFVKNAESWLGHPIPDYSHIEVDCTIPLVSGRARIRIDNGSSLPYFGISLNTIIFSHEFAKAFWGDLEIIALTDSYGVELIGDMGEVAYLVCWQYHLQQMVLEENPIDYLRKFVEG